MGFSLNSFLMAAVLLVLIAAPHAARSAEVIMPVSGTAFYWDTLLNVGFVTDAKASVISALQSDMRAEVDNTTTLTVTDVEVNASALFVSFTVLPDEDATDAQQKVFMSPLRALNNYLISVRDQMMHMEEVFPLRVLFTTDVLYPRPVDVPEPEPNVVSTASSGHVILISGAPDTWATILASQGSRAPLEQAISDAAARVVYRPLMASRVVTHDLSTQKVGDKKAMGGGEGGLRARLAIMQKLESGALRAFSSDEVNSILPSMDLQGVEALFGAGGTPLQVIAAATDADYDSKCDSLCKGMIAMGVIAGFITIASLVCVAMYVCCCATSDNKAERESSGYYGSGSGNPLERQRSYSASSSKRMDSSLSRRSSTRYAEEYP